MSAFHIRFETSPSTLRIWTDGLFDRTAARQLHGVLDEQYSGQERIFIDTAGLETQAAGGSLFRDSFAHSRIPASLLYFKGEKALGMAPDGSKILLRPKRPEGKKHGCRCHEPGYVCTGRCPGCTCKH